MVDPEAVRKALAEIDRHEAMYDRDEIDWSLARTWWSAAAQDLIPAARAWLEQQDKGEDD